MITAKQVDADTMLVTFTAPDFLDGAEADVVGDFNDWQPGCTRFEDRIATVTVQPGRYRFRYLTTDGSWFNDEQADDYEDNDFGGQDGVVDLTGWADPENGADADADAAAARAEEAADPDARVPQPDAARRGIGESACGDRSNPVAAARGTAPNPARGRKVTTTRHG